MTLSDGSVYFGYGFSDMGIGHYRTRSDDQWDCIIPATHDDDIGTNRGKVAVFWLNTDGTVRSHRKLYPNGSWTVSLSDSNYLGYGTLTALDDLNGDGYLDALIGQNYNDDAGTNNGMAWITLINRDGEVTSFQKIAPLSNEFTADFYNVNYNEYLYNYYAMSGCAWGRGSNFIIGSRGATNSVYNVPFGGKAYAFFNENSCEGEPEQEGYDFTGQEESTIRLVSCAAGMQGNASDTVSCWDGSWTLASGCTDIDGCESEGGSCSSSGDSAASCVDVAAPGTGFYCDCSEGMTEEEGVCVEAEVVTEPPMAGGSSANAGSDPLMFSAADSSTMSNMAILMLAVSALA